MADMHVLFAAACLLADLALTSPPVPFPAPRAALACGLVLGQFAAALALAATAYRTPARGWSGRWLERRSTWWPVLWSSLPAAWVASAWLLARASQRSVGPWLASLALFALLWVAGSWLADRISSRMPTRFTVATWMFLTLSLALGLGIGRWLVLRSTEWNGALAACSLFAALAWVAQRVSAARHWYWPSAYLALIVAPCLGVVVHAFDRGGPAAAYILLAVSMAATVVVLTRARVAGMRAAANEPRPTHEAIVTG